MSDIPLNIVPMPNFPTVINNIDCLLESGETGKDILELISQQAFNAQCGGKLPSILQLKRESSYWLHGADDFKRFMKAARLGLSSNSYNTSVYVEIEFTDERDIHSQSITMAGLLYVGGVVSISSQKNLDKSANNIRDELAKFFNYKDAIPSLIPTPTEFPCICDVIQKAQHHFESLSGGVIRYKNKIAFQYLGIEWLIQMNCDRSLPDDKTFIDVCNSNGDLLVTVIAKIKSDI